MTLHYVCGRCKRSHPKGTSCVTKRKRSRDTRATNVRRHEKAKAHGLHSAEWKRTRRRRLEMDGHRCQRCERHRDELESNERLTVHLDPALEGDHLIATVDDCETQCSTCHGVTDGHRARKAA